MASRRYGNGGAATFQAVQGIIKQVGVGFHPSQDPVMELAREIEKCSRKIWACSTDEDYKANKKARTFNMNNAESEKVVVQPESGDNHGKNSDLSVEELEGFLNAMKYRDMQLRCKEYGLFAAGNKEILRVRLFRYLSQQAGSIGTDVLKQTEEHKATTEVLKQTEEHKATTEDEIAIDVVKVPSVEHVETKADVDIKMEDAQPSIEKAPTAMPAKEIATSNLVEPVRVSCAGTMQPTKETTSELVVEEHVKDPSGSFSSEGAGPAIPIREIGTKSPLRVFVKDAVKQMTHSAQKARLVGHISTPGDHLSPPPSDCTASTSCSKISGTRVREIVSKLTTSQPSSTLSNKLQASKDARMARLAEVRGKSQLAKAGTAKPEQNSKEQSATLPSQNKKPAQPNNSSNLKMNLAAQMREKALRNDNRMGTLGLGNNDAKPKLVPVKTTPVPDSLGATLKSSALLGSTLKTYSAVKKPKSPPRPSQTYEISDREDSDSDDSEDEDGKRKKELPKWVSKENLRPALHAQYIGKTLDPDEIFGEVHTCDLEAIFGNQMKSKYRSRTSSGNWTQDRVTAAEKLVYKRTMGFVDEI